MEDYYEILGVTSNSSQAEIKKAYRALAIQYHPDKNNGDSLSEERFKAIAEAYIVLSDMVQRDAYDYAKRYQVNPDGTPQTTPVTFLGLFKKIKTQIFNAGGQVNQEALFKVMDDILSDENITLLIREDDIHTNSLILDEILVSCIFLSDALKAAIHPKLVQLANGDARFIKKIAVLDKNASTTGTTQSADEQPSVVLIVLFVIVVVSVLFMIF
ncbi:J domain-containing protein [Flavobacterium litorale]|uniref:DnaJ domain-containing protein n=1 Tax=Flavobacterium litorale TaxID=2856519 RepID=A0ABX8V4W1_9FLAO|nr:DnaJ domain-containing protein [Flavobacterium litorale]QYJ67835.1 DnaJ domain-containing protein [Flavobacterium litorale]